MAIKIQDLTYHHKSPYKSRAFDTQESFRLSFIDDDMRVFETGVYIHWNQDNLLDIALDLSLMSGCTEKCKFCASSLSSGKRLRNDAVVEQVEQSLKFLCEYRPEVCSSLKKLTISFQGMGEVTQIPTKILKEIIDQIKREYSSKYNCIFLVSTIGKNPDRIIEWADNNIVFETVQFSLHSALDHKRIRLIQEDLPSIENVIEAIDLYKKKYPNTLVKINYLLMNGEDISNCQYEDFNALVNLLENKDKDTWLVKISHLNSTIPSEKNNLRKVSSAQLHDAINYLINKGINCYEYGSKSDIGISCGQLASYAEREILFGEDNYEDINEIYEELIDENLILFLGAGVSSTVWNADQLAKELLKEFSLKHKPSISLADVVEILKHKGRRHSVYTKIFNTLMNTPYPKEHLILTTFPWKAIYTTNYDTFIERAYKDSQSKGITDYSCFPIVSRMDFQKDRPKKNCIPLYKLHGCISRQNYVLSKLDYLKLSRDHNRMFLFNRLESDLLDSKVLFAGYGFNDSHISNILFHANRNNENSGDKIRTYYSISPISSTSQNYGFSRIYENEYGIKTISCRFDDLLRELLSKKRKIRIFISGSLRSAIPFADEAKRTNCYQEGIDLCKALGKLIARNNWSLLSGATATDKVGHLVASSVIDNGGSIKNIINYVWHGAKQKDFGNEIDDLKCVHYYGNNPSDVINKILQSSNVTIFIGGARLCLEEIFESISKKLLVIPISLGDRAYSSTILHNFIKDNISSLKSMNKDISASGRLYRRVKFAEYLTDERLIYLDLSINTVETVCNTISEIITEFEGAMFREVSSNM